MTSGPSSREPLRFGILGTGWIAGRFATAIGPSPAVKLQAVGSRSPKNAESFAGRHTVEHAHGSYEALLADSTVEAVYVSTPSPRHRDDCLMCLAAGKHVLCEKPFATNAAEAREIVAMAREKSLFCMEAMWMRFHPLVQSARAKVTEGVLGDPLALRAEIGNRWRADESNRLFRPELGGGAILDMGVYAVSLAHFLLGPPVDVVARARAAPGGVDETTAVVLTHERALSVLTASIGAELDNEAHLVGSDRRLILGPPFFNPGWMRVAPVTELPPLSPGQSGPAHRAGPVARVKRALIRQRAKLRAARAARHGTRRTGDLTVVPFGTSAFRLEAEEVARCIRAGKHESDVMPLEDSVQVMETLDRIREASL